MEFQAKFVVVLVVYCFTALNAFTLTEVEDEMALEDDAVLFKEVCRNHQVT